MALLKKYCLIGSLILLSLGLVFLLSFKFLVTQYTADKAQNIIAEVYKNKNFQTDDQKITALTQYVFQNFTQVDPSKNIPLRLRGYITNKRLPKFIRLNDGVIETIFQQGQCDNAVRMLSFLLKQEGYQSVQWNMVSHNNGHSALLVTLPDGRKGYVDPFFGYTANNNGKLINPIEAQKLEQSALVPFDKNREHDFYKGFKNLMMAAEGDDLVISTKIPNLYGKTLVLGGLDGEWRDVKRDAKQHNMTQYWYYMGHKYNREWIRTLEATGPVKMTMTLVDAPDQKVITSNIPPEIIGNNLIWTLHSKDKLSFIDGDAEISLKRMNSFIGVDQIIFSPLK